MLISHKIIDLLRGRDRDHQLVLIPTRDGESPAALADLIDQAEKFDFGDVPLEPRPEEGSYQPPSLTAAEWEAFGRGMVPLPAPLCWYEYVVKEIRICVLIVQKTPTENLVWVVDWPRGSDVRLLLLTLPMSIDWNECWKEGHVVCRLEPGGSPAERSLIDKHFTASPMRLMTWLTLMLNSRSTEKTRSAPPDKLNRRRAARGEAPLVPHTVVNIVPGAYLEAQRRLGGTHRSPRLHWRRSHIRRYANGREIIIPRFLVGRAELGEVSQEYRVKL